MTSRWSPSGMANGNPFSLTIYQDLSSRVFHWQKKIKGDTFWGEKKETPFNFLTLLYYYALEPKSCFSNSFRNKILFSFSAEHCCTACLSTIKKAYFKKNQTPNSRKIKLKKGNIRRKFSTRMNIMGLLR